MRESKIVQYLLRWIDDEVNLPRDSYNEYTTTYDEGYRKGLKNIRQYILQLTKRQNIRKSVSLT